MNLFTGSTKQPNWLPAGPALVCVLEISGQLYEHVATAVAAAGAQLVHQIPPETAVAAVLIGPDVLMDRRKVAEILSHQSCPLILVGHSLAESELWAKAARERIHHVVSLPEGTAWLAEFLNTLQDRTERGSVVAVIGGCGGAGASTAAGMLALKASREKIRTLLVDADPWGFGLEGALSSDPVEGLHWHELSQSVGVLNSQQFSAALPQIAHCSVLGFGRAAQAAQQLNPALVIEVLEAARRAFELIVIDVGRMAKNLETFCESADQVLCLVPATVPAMLSVHRMLPMLPRSTKLVVRRPAPEGLDAELIAESLGLPLVGEMPKLRGVSAAAAQGRLSDCASNRALGKLFSRTLSTLKDVRR